MSIVEVVRPKSSRSIIASSRAQLQHPKPKDLRHIIRSLNMNNTNNNSKAWLHRLEMSNDSFFAGQAPHTAIHTKELKEPVQQSHPQTVGTRAVGASNNANDDRRDIDMSNTNVINSEQSRAGRGALVVNVPSQLHDTTQAFWRMEETHIMCAKDLYGFHDISRFGTKSFEQEWWKQRKEYFISKFCNDTSYLFIPLTIRMKEYKRDYVAWLQNKLQVEQFWTREEKLVCSTFIYRESSSIDDAYALERIVQQWWKERQPYFLTDQPYLLSTNFDSRFRFYYEDSNKWCENKNHSDV